MLKRGSIRAIQFEYGYIDIDTHFLLKDSYDYLGGMGIRIGKIYPTYVNFRDYRHSNEDFYGPNYVAVHSTCTTFVDALSDRSTSPNGDRPPTSL